MATLVRAARTRAERRSAADTGRTEFHMIVLSITTSYHDLYASAQAEEHGVL